MDLPEPRKPGERNLFHISDDEYTVSSRPGESPLCSICQKIMDKFSEVSYVSITTNLRIENRARDGCYVCSLFLYRFQSHRSTYYTRRGPKFVTRYRDWPIGTIRLSLEQYDEAATLTVQQTKGPLYWVDKSCSVQGVVCKGHISDSYVSPQMNTINDTLQIACMWLQRCQAQHRSCRVAAANFLPTRLIDIGVDFWTTPSVSLCLGEDITSRARYVTLSHCWGEPASMTASLKMNTIESMMRSINFNCLPNTFRDAVQVTRRLGIRYIWIDSLCIVQDSQEDWERESALMAQVYSNAICNISATAAQDSSGGLFFDQNCIATRHVKAYLRRYSKLRQLFTFCEKDLWSSGVERALLNGRGWVLQERLLSCRNLHFSHNQVFWECHESTASEMFPVAMPKVFLPGGSGQDDILKTSYSRLVLAISRGEASLCKFGSFWNDLVVYYSKCHLSQCTDKLVAFGGLVAQIQKAFGGRYLAGVWWDDLVHQLCWRREDSNPYTAKDWEESSASSSLLSPYIAPTWSWASSSYPVANVCSLDPYQQDGTEIVVDIIDAHVDLVSNNPYGQVKGAYLAVQGRLCQLELQGADFCVRHGLDITPVASWGDELEFFWDHPRRVSMVTRDSKLQLCLLPVLLYPASKTELELHVMEGLILRPSTNMPLRFQRCGTFIAYHTTSVEGILSACGYFDVISKSFGLEPFKSNRGWPSYAITVV